MLCFSMYSMYISTAGSRNILDLPRKLCGDVIVESKDR